MTTELPTKNADWCVVLSRKGLEASTKLLLESLHNSSDPLHRAFARTYGEKLQVIVGDVVDAPISRDEHLYLLVEQARTRRRLQVKAAISEVAEHERLKLDTVRQAYQRVLRTKTISIRQLTEDELRALTLEERDGFYEHLAEKDLNLKGRPSKDMENVRRYVLLGDKPCVVVRKPVSEQGEG